MLERLADTNLLIAAALATFAAPIAFLALVAVAARQRARDQRLTQRTESLLAFAGGLCLGTFLLFGSDVLLAAPIAVVAGALLIGRWRAGRRSQAGWLGAGIGLPLAAAWGTVLTSSTPSLTSYGLVTAAAWAAGGGLLAFLGLAVALRGDPAPPAPSPAAPAGQPGSRRIGSIVAAIKQPAMLGPFGQPEVAMLVGLIASLLVIPVLLPRSLPTLLAIAVSSVLAAAVATEAYVRAWPTRSRLGFEAFSWLGEWELANFRRLYGGGPPTNPARAAQWLAAHPEQPAQAEAAGGRAEVLLLAGRIDEARALAERMPRSTPGERFEQAAIANFVDWLAGGDGDLAAMERAAAEIEPVDGDERLRAEVSVAAAKVRRNMADGRPQAGDAIQPLLDVRERLGHRADGQVGRALRRRLFPVLALASFAIGLVMDAVAALGIVLG